MGLVAHRVLLAGCGRKSSSACSKALWGVRVAGSAAAAIGVYWVAAPSISVLGLSSYGDEHSVKAMLQAGAAGYLVKQTAAAELSQAIRQVSRGHGFLSPAIARRVREQVRAPSSAADELREREREVLTRIAQGLLNKQIAAELGISIKTVEKHRQQVINKLRIHDIAGQPSTRH